MLQIGQSILNSQHVRQITEGNYAFGSILCINNRKRAIYLALNVCMLLNVLNMRLWGFCEVLMELYSMKR